jgi:hypothetical protein
LSQSGAAAGHDLSSMIAPGEETIILPVQENLFLKTRE